MNDPRIKPWMSVDGNIVIVRGGTPSAINSSAEPAEQHKRSIIIQGRAGFLRMFRRRTSVGDQVKI